MHLLHVFPSFQVGGSQRRFAALANHFGGKYRHSVFSLNGDFAAADLVKPGIALTRCPPPPRLPLPLALLHNRRALRVIAPDVLITYNWGAIEWAAADLPRLVRHIHIEDGFGPEEAAGQIRRRVLFRRWVLNRHSTIILPSQTLVRLATGVWRLDARRVNYVPNGIPTARFQKPADAGLVATFRGSGPVIGTVAALRAEKALDRLIRAFAALRKHQPLRLVIVGDGVERSKLEALAESLGLSGSTTFTGALEQPERAVTGFDVFAISSNTEQMPLSVLEAMAAGVPIASTDVGDVRRMVATENQQFVAGADAEALGASLSRLIADGDLRRRLGEANRSRAVAEYDESRMFAAYDRFFSGAA